MELTQKELKKQIKYCYESGEITRISTNGIVKTISVTGYNVVNINKKIYKTHRLVWLYVYGYMPTCKLDHINHNRTDNRISNLREVTDKDNCRNCSISKNNTSGINGVSFIRKTKKWRARIMVNRKEINLGRFSDKKDALEARKHAEKLYGFHENHGK